MASIESSDFVTRLPDAGRFAPRGEADAELELEVVNPRPRGARASRRRRHRGAGLGIVRTAALMHGGSFTLELDGASGVSARLVLPRHAPPGR